ncbi:MAG TPA: phosphatase PAP2 family protein [Solirubrobacteraceae bacterium]|nr:phosphatase PAP2 family protein [Solirubrobacteraceae bacterium]HLM87039.1 phosphatase PAP2 family protein [Solirubrobacteraceae bacterium]
MQGHAYTAATLPARSAPGRERRSGAGNALGAAGLCVLAMALVWAVAELVPAVQWKDAAVLHDFTLLSRPSVDQVANFLLHLLSPLPFTLWGVALAAFAIAGGRPRVALAVIAVMGLAPLSAELLKPLLAHPHLHVGGTYVGPASWPSGHSTAALALVLSAVLVAPARLRALVAVIGGAYALAVGCALLILVWHMPSDVLGGYLVAAFWMALSLAALRAADRRWPTRTR